MSRTAPARSRRALWRRPLTWVGATVLALVTWLVAGWFVIVNPPEATAHRADVVFVIGPATTERIAMARQLYDEGFVTRALVSIDPDDVDIMNDPASGCDLPAVTCVVPDPSTTRGEAAMLNDYAAENDVRSALVITFTPHVSRTRYIFDHCADPDVTVLAAPGSGTTKDWAWQFAYQSGAFLKAVAVGCS